jgi:hypothetical protein
MMVVQAASERSVVALPARGMDATAARGERRLPPRQESSATSSTRGRLVDIVV